jgi:hypothetical protein
VELYVNDCSQEWQAVWNGAFPAGTVDGHVQPRCDLGHETAVTPGEAWRLEWKLCVDMKLTNGSSYQKYRFAIGWENTNLDDQRIHYQCQPRRVGGWAFVDWRNISLSLFDPATGVLSDMALLQQLILRRYRRHSSNAAVRITARC